MSKGSALRYRLAAYCARIRPGTTAELASLVLQMSDEIDTRERMLDAALRPAPDLAALRREPGRRGGMRAAAAARSRRSRTQPAGPEPGGQTRAS
jgi:hypothetical protein